MELPIQQLQFGEDFNFFISSNIWIKSNIFWKAFYHSMPKLSLVATHPCTPQNHNSHSQTTSFEQKFGFLIGAWSVVWNFWILCESIVLYQNTKAYICLFEICIAKNTFHQSYSSLIPLTQRNLHKHFFIINAFFMVYSETM